MSKARTGKTLHLILAAFMTLSIVIIAIFLNTISISTLVPAIAVINTDYQIESAMIMQMQKSHNNPLETLRTLDKEIMPGVLMHLESTTTDGRIWQFKATVTGHGLDRSITAKAFINRPDQLIFSDDN